MGHRLKYATDLVQFVRILFFTACVSNISLTAIGFEVNSKLWLLPSMKVVNLREFRDDFL